MTPENPFARVLRPENSKFDKRVHVAAQVAFAIWMGFFSDGVWGKIGLATLDENLTD
jgi:hypothetical protein